MEDDTLFTERMDPALGFVCTETAAVLAGLVVWKAEFEGVISDESKDADEGEVKDDVVGLNPPNKRELMEWLACLVRLS